MRRFISALAITTLCLSGAAFAQETGAKDEAKKAGEATKDAGKSTVDAAKHIGKATGKATVKGTKKATHATKDAVQRTWTCVDGTTDEATLKANACKTHGGVQADVKVDK